MHPSPACLQVLDAVSAKHNGGDLRVDAVVAAVGDEGYFQMEDFNQGQVQGQQRHAMLVQPLEAWRKLKKKQPRDWWWVALVGRVGVTVY